ncbi:hypothetical protein [uncultured Kocuria sp.]|uniref:hypothetical protein n=1 Tax=uncultured Kocuria sp. TaxID=259305 RepID=UPI00260E2323|nr:hypothetical protein [uncultured Kocuria sp.]
MYARVSTYEGAYPEDYDSGLDALRSEVLPGIQALRGYRGSLSLVERSTGRSVSITFWADEEALVATRQAVEQIRERAAATSGSRILDVTEYEVGYSDLP